MRAKLARVDRPGRIEHRARATRHALLPASGGAPALQGGTDLEARHVSCLGRQAALQQGYDLAGEVAKVNQDALVGLEALEVLLADLQRVEEEGVILARRVDAEDLPWRSGVLRVGVVGDLERRATKSPCSSSSWRTAAAAADDSGRHRTSRHLQRAPLTLRL